MMSRRLDCSLDDSRRILGTFWLGIFGETWTNTTSSTSIITRPKSVWLLLD